MRLAVTLLATVIAGCAAPRGEVPAPVEMLRLIDRGRAAETRGDGEGARIAYEEAVRAYDHCSAWAQLGEYRRFWARDAAGAEEAFQRALKAPAYTGVSRAFAWRGLGELARSRGDVDGAIACFEKSLAIRDLLETHRSLSALYATERRDFRRAARHAKAAADGYPEDPIAQMQYAVQLVRFEKLNDAEEAFMKSIRLAGCDPRGRSDDLVHCCVLYNGACYHAVRGDKALALAWLKEFFLTPNHRHITKDEILRDPDFESLVKDDDFKALLEYRLPLE